MSMEMNVEARSHPIKEWGKSLTRQSEAKYADINLIMAKYQKTGVLPPATRQGFFADISKAGDYRDALDRIQQMEEYFYQVPPKIRKQFDNDPAEFLDFVTNPQNMEQIEEMGLIAVDRPAEPPAPPAPGPGPAPDGPIEGPQGA